MEHAHSLEQSLNAHCELQQCQEDLSALRVRYEDREAAWEADRREKERLGTLFLEEIVKLSAREVEGEKSKKEMELKVKKLEDELKTRADVAPSQNNRIAVVEKEENAEVGEPSQLVSGIEKEGGKMISEPDSKTIPATDLEGKESIPDTTIVVDDNKPAEEGGVEPTPATAAPEKSTTNNAEEVQGFVPHNLDETALMEIFSYLDPMEVMNFAQTNKALLSKVNIMFGMGSESSASEHEQQSSAAEPDVESSAASVEMAEPNPLHPAQTTVPAVSTVQQTVPSTSATVPSSTASSKPPASPTKSSPKLFGLHGPMSHRRQGSGASVATAGSGGTANPFAQVSSWFGGGDASSVALTVPTVPSSAASTGSGTGSIDTGSEIKLNAAMASSMASKLTPAELSIILRMREKLQRCEADANKWRSEKDDAMANLASVEAVKEFLVTRVRDTERVVQKQKEDVKVVEKKSLEDQEVIVFLDEKVKALEKQVEEIKSTEATAKQESLNIVNKNEKMARVLSDMLQFEREQMASNEKEWKAAKKVLVKEVKSCRARIIALEAEVDGCRQQNSQLKQGLMSMQTSIGSPGGKKHLKSFGRH